MPGIQKDGDEKRVLLHQNVRVGTRNGKKNLNSTASLNILPQQNPSDWLEFQKSLGPPLDRGHQYFIQLRG